MSFGIRLKTLREEVGLTQEELGKIINVSKPTISRYESNSNEPNSEILKKLASFFKVSIDYILCNTDVREPADKILEKPQDTIALHRNDGYDDDLPEEARKEIEDFKEYVRHKYGKKKD